MKQHIIAMGGGGFTHGPDHLGLDRYAIAQTGKVRPKVCFIPTASGDSDTYIQQFHSSYQSLNCTTTHLSLYKPPTTDFDSFVKDHDMIYVGGGNTRNLMVLWRDWGLDEVIRPHLQKVW